MESYDGKILRIREVGDPILSIKCKKVDVKNFSEEDYRDIEDLKASLDFSGGYGIAAPPVGINKSSVIIKVDKEKCNYRWFFNNSEIIHYYYIIENTFWFIRSIIKFIPFNKKIRTIF